MIDKSETATQGFVDPERMKTANNDALRSLPALNEHELLEVRTATRLARAVCALEDLSKDGDLDYSYLVDELSDTLCAYIENSDKPDWVRIAALEEWPNLAEVSS